MSTKDVAKGYSIRNIIKNKIVKLPNTKIGNIVITTKDVNLEDELEITEYNVIILKLMNYKDKVETVEKFLDNQINKIFKEYISKDKKENINDINERLEKISTELLKQDENLEKIFLIESIKYSGLENEYIEISNLQKKLSKNSNNGFKNIK